ncbi:MAG: aminoacyl-tRNA hydrolase [Gammaproteobacteria bacterium]|nr:aminoacyl-tRNA hydrolase [Gammaproteobacteria bacterium]
MSNRIKLIVGLGNPGRDYERTRHNAGADFVTELARHYGAQLTSDSKLFGLVGRITVGGHDLRLINPTTYMNRSGQAVAAIANFYKILPNEILVAHDELDLPCGVAKLKFAGGHGGHNGLRDIIASLGNSKDFYRLRLGIDHPGNSKAVANYVLKRATQSEQLDIDNAIDRSIKVTDLIAAGEFEKAMNSLHSSN